MQKNFNLSDVQSKLGYTFKNTELAKNAFIHKSNTSSSDESNTRLVFLGEKLISFAISDYVFSHSASTDTEHLSAECEYYLKALAPERYIKEHSLEKYAVLSDENSRESDTLARELFYALAAAIYRDGGLPTLKGFLMPLIRSCGATEHYTPSTGGRVLLRSEPSPSEDKHISAARLNFKAKRSVIGINRAKTIDIKDTDKREENVKDNNFSKSQGRVAPKTEAVTSEKSENTNILPQKRFIRDPFAPVKLSDELRNFKPKKQASYDKSTSSAPITEPENVLAIDDTSLESNYKSLLQELIQKNIRTANVAIKYEVNKSSRTDWDATVSLSENVIGSGNGGCKKEAEQAAAKCAYLAISDKNSSEYKLFLSLCTDNHLTLSTPSTDYISKINRYFQKTQHLSSAPVVYKRMPSAEKGIYIFAIMCDGKEVAAGKATTAKEAKQNAAKIACEILKIN